MTKAPSRTEARTRAILSIRPELGPDVDPGSLPGLTRALGQTTSYASSLHYLAQCSARESESGAPESDETRDLEMITHACQSLHALGSGISRLYETGSGIHTVLHIAGRIEQRLRLLGGQLKTSVVDLTKLIAALEEIRIVIQPLADAAIKED